MNPRYILIVLSVLSLAPGALSADEADGRFTYEVGAVKAAQLAFRERMHWFSEAGARLSGICHPGRVDRAPPTGWMVWHKCDGQARYAGVQ